MKQIRLSVFETNSSSSHSLTLGKGNLVAVPFPAEALRAGVIEVCTGQYNWEYRRYYTPMEKMRYLLTQATQNLYAEVPDAGGGIAATQSLRDENERVDMLCSVVEAYTGCKLLVTVANPGIDHQSEGNGMQCFNDAETLKSFLFDEASYIQTGNDNSPPPWEISTDKGPELFYGSRIREVPKSWMAVDVTEESDKGLKTAAGASLSLVRNAQLYADLVDNGVLQQVNVIETGAYALYDREYGNVRLTLAKQYARKEDSGYFFTCDFQGGAKHQKTPKGYTSQATFTFKVSPKLAAAIKALEATPAEVIQMDELVERIDEFDKALLALPSRKDLTSYDISLRARYLENFREAHASLAALHNTFPEHEALFIQPAAPVTKWRAIRKSKKAA